MKEIQDVLRFEGSALSGAVRGTLCGLAVALRDGRRFGNPEDPAAAAADRLLDALDTLLGQVPRPHDEIEFNPPPAPSSPPRKDLGALRERFLAAPEVRAELPGFTPPSKPAADVWISLNLALLRLSPAPATRWRNELLAEAADDAVEDNCLQLPWGEDALIFPGWSGSPSAPGLRLSSAVPAQPKPGPVPADGTVALALFRIVSIAHWFTDNDPDLHHALNPFGLLPLQDASHRARYQGVLIDRYRRFAQSEQAGSAAQALEAWVDLDEAIHCLSHKHVPSPGSWWGRLLRGSRNTLDGVRALAATGPSVSTRELAGEYASALRYAGKSDLSTTGWEPPGHILRCLRIYLKIDGEETPGRVLYRSC